MSSKTLSLPLILPSGAVECARCVAWLGDAIRAIPGVDAVAVDQAASLLTVSYDPSLVSAEAVERRAHELGAEVALRFHHETMTLTDMDCADCARTIQKAVGDLPGIVHASVNFAAAKLDVEYDTPRLSREQIVHTITQLGYGVEEAHERWDMQFSTFRLAGLAEPEQARRVEAIVKGLPGVKSAAVSFGAGTLVVAHDPQTAAVERILQALFAAGFDASLEGARAAEPPSPPYWRRSPRLATTAAAGLAVLGGFAASAFAPASEMAVGLFALAIVVGGTTTARSAIYSLRYLTFDMNVLMTAAVIGAVVIGQWSEAATIVFLFALSNTLESYTVDRTRGAIRALMRLAPQEATVLHDGAATRLPVERVGVGDHVIVRPGERIPMDGVVVGGTSDVDQSPITGESLPVEKTADDEVFAGSINGRGTLEVQVTKLAKDTAIAKVVHLVEEAQAQRAPSQQFVDRFSRYYTPGVIALAVVVATVPPLVLGLPFDQWFYRALVLLLIACPCALVIATPVTIISAIGTAARAGILIKGGSNLEEAGKVVVVAFDKTGTLTYGQAAVTDVVGLNGPDQAEVLRLAAAVEARSKHPLGAAILREARHGGITPREMGDFEAIVGRGVRASVNGATYYVGSPSWFAERGVSLAAVNETLLRWQGEGKTALLLGDDERLLGMIAVADRPRPAAREAIAGLRRAGIQQVVILTGDNEVTAAAIGRELGVDDVRAELLPEDKVEAVRQLMRRHQHVMMVGDGVNDAPALAEASAGVAMGAAGTDVALETADIALMADDLSRLPFTIRLSRRAVATIRQNIGLALLVKLAFLVLAVLGLATLWMAVLADTGASLVVIANGLRLLGQSPK